MAVSSGSFEDFLAHVLRYPRKPAKEVTVEERDGLVWISRDGVLAAVMPPRWYKALRDYAPPTPAPASQPSGARTSSEQLSKPLATAQQEPPTTQRTDPT